MNLAAFSVRRWQFTVVVFGMLAALGGSSLLSIPKAEDPTFPYPNFAIVLVYPGAVPGDLEKLVVDPIEAKLKALDEVKTLKSEMSDGLAVLNIEFNAGADPDRKYDDVLRELNALRPTLPVDLQSVEVKKFNASNVNILQAALVSDTASYLSLQELADRLKKRLDTVPGTKDATRWAYPVQEVRVALDLERLAALGITPLQVVGAIQATNANIPAGSLDVGKRKFNVKTSGDYASIAQIEETVVAARGDALVRLRDVAQVDLRDSEATHLGRFDGRRAVFITVAQRDGQNIFQLRKALEKQLADFRRELPESVRLEVGFDQARNVSHRLDGFLRDFGLAIALVLLTLLPLGWRAALVVMISIPLSLAIGVAALNLTGFSINQLSIVGFVIALGLLVDDSIVVVENITRFLREGHSRPEAAVEATRQIGVSVLGCTATLVFAFLPLLFLPGAPGLFIRSMPMAVVFTVLASLFVSLTIIPFLASLMLRKEEHPDGNWFLRALNRAVDLSYRRLLHRALARPWLTVGVAAGLFAGSVALVPLIGFSLFPKAGLPQFMVIVETPDGSNLGATDQAVRFVEDQLAGRHEVRAMMANVGQGNPRIYYNVSPKNQKSNTAEVFVTTADLHPPEMARLIAELRGRFSRYAGAKIELKEFENGPPLDAPVAVRVIGERLDVLEPLAAEVEKLLLETTGTTYVRNPSTERKTDLRVAIDREKAGLQGVALLDLDRSVRMGLGGIEVGRYRAEGQADEAYKINVMLPRTGERPSLDALDRIYVPSALSGQVPLRQLSTLEFEGSPTTINHYNKERSITLTAEVLPGYNTDKVTRAVLAKVASLKLPAGYRIVPAGEYESRQESFGGLGSAIIVAAFGVLAVLVLEFRTFKSTAIVASVIPLGIIGGLLALGLTGNTLSFTAAIGFIALIGIEVKNSILLVDFTNQLRAKGMGLREAIEEAGKTRFIPILLTTATALGGLLPLALENSSLYSPLAWVIIGGLLSSTLLTRLVTPVVYELLAPEVELEPAAATTPAPEQLAARVAA
ncbi:MAG TPA: efflux RND transporter permease subunit [Myxococcaceae bacterium]|nr:efflux RND transporter permease subunit [Myxococcaceae bacterium]